MLLSKSSTRGGWMQEAITRLRHAGINQNGVRSLHTGCESLRRQRSVRQFVAEGFDGHDRFVQ
jgi:hypothetical protein